MSGKVLHILHGTSRMGGYEIRHDPRPQPCPGAYPVKLDTEPFEQLERRLPEIVKYFILSMFRSHLQATRSMVQDKRLKIRTRCVVHESVLGQEQVVTYAAAAL